MYRVRYRVNQHPWQFLDGCFGSKEQAAAAMHAHAGRRNRLIVKYQVVMRAWYANR